MHDSLLSLGSELQVDDGVVVIADPAKLDFHNAQLEVDGRSVRVARLPPLPPDTIKVVMLLMVLSTLLASTGCVAAVPANVREMHKVEKSAHDAGVARREQLLDAYDDDLVDALEFQGELAFRLEATTKLVEDKLAREALEQGLASWAAYRAQQRVKRGERRVKRGEASAEDGPYVRAHSSTERWLGKAGITEEAQEQILGEASAIAGDIASRQARIEAAKAAERERAKIEAEAAEKEARGE